MAILNAYLGFNLNNIDLNWYSRYFYRSDFYNNSYFSGFPGGPYEDLYQIAGSSSRTSQYLSVGGNGMVQDVSGAIISGTANYMSEGLASGALIWDARGFSLSASAIWQAGLTASNSDDYALVAQALSGNDTITLSRYDDLMGGFSGDDSIVCNAGNDVAYGHDGSDWLDGGTGNDYLVGGFGKDYLTGGQGSDRFAFIDANDSGLGTFRDVIRDFTKADWVDLRLIDADARRGGDQRFEFIGSRNFTGDAGELRFQSGVLYGDVDGDKLADFEIELTGVSRLSQSDIIL